LQHSHCSCCCRGIPDIVDQAVAKVILPRKNTVTRFIFTNQYYMKTTNSLFLVIGLLLVSGLVSCTKEQMVKSNTELLTQKSWKFVTQGLDENNNGVIEESESEMLSCLEDDQFGFNVNGTGSYTIGTLQCSPDDENVTFSWRFSNNETELTILSYPEKIKKLDDNTLEIYLEQENSAGQTVKYIRKFQH
jgi:hypothetical protein